MGRDHHGGSPRGARMLAQDVHDTRGVFVIERRCRLIGQQQLWTRDKGASDRGALRFSMAQRCQAKARTVQNFQPLQQRIDVSA